MNNIIFQNNLFVYRKERKEKKKPHTPYLIGGEFEESLKIFLSILLSYFNKTNFDIII